MSGPILATSVLVVSLGASIVVGLVSGRKSISLLISLAFGIATAVVRIQYAPDPAALPGLVGYPLMCMGLNRLGAFFRRWIQLGSRKGSDDTPPVTR